MTRSRPRRSKTQLRARVAAVVVTVAAIVATSASGCGSADGVVGGGCASAYTQCGLSCVDLQTDEANCGACGHACAASIACVGGACANVSLDATIDGDGTIDASVEADVDGESLDAEDCDANDPGCHRLDSGHDGASDSGDSSLTSDDASDESSTSDDGPAPSETSTSDASNDGSIPDAAPFDACVPPFDLPEACGACGVVCTDPNPLCSFEDGGYACAPACPSPLVPCEGHCVNLARDPTNCGACGTTCPSQYCFLSTCQGNVAGNVIVIGHDFDTTKGTDQEAKLLTNAVFYSPPTVRLLSFEHYANAAALANAKAILAAYATTEHYTLTLSATSDDTFIGKGLTIANEDAVIIWDQPNAPSGTLGTLGSQWASSLSKFTQGGGLVIVLDAAQGVAQMPALETNAALLAVTGHTSVASGTPADVPLAGVSIARGMTSVYVVGTNTASFTTSESSTKVLFVANVQGQATQLLAVQKIVN